MGQIKDKALKNKPESKKFTLTPTEIAGLMESRALAQQTLDFMLQSLTSIYLKQIATGRLGFDPTKTYDFSLDLEKEADNLTITELAA